MELRPEVRAFAEAMEAQLRANDHKPGWKNDSAFSLLVRLQEEKDELLEAVSCGRIGSPEWAKRVVKETADVANFAMMIADVCGGLGP